MTQPKGKKRTIDNKAERKYEPAKFKKLTIDDPAERKETKNGCPSRKERNEKWSTQQKGSTSQLKGKK